MKGLWEVPLLVDICNWLLLAAWGTDVQRSRSKSQSQLCSWTRDPLTSTVKRQKPAWQFSVWCSSNKESFNLKSGMWCKKSITIFRVKSFSQLRTLWLSLLWGVISLLKMQGAVTMGRDSLAWHVGSTVKNPYPYLHVIKQKQGLT